MGILVILWAVVLVPMWLRRHDKTSELAAADRFAGAMRVLSRRSGERRAAGAGRYVLMPARSAAARAMHVHAPQRRRQGPPDPGRPAGPRPAGRRARVAARRRLAVVLATLLVVTVVAAVAGGGAFVVVQGFTDVLVLAGVLHLRSGVLAERARDRRAAAQRSAVQVRQAADARWVPTPPRGRRPPAPAAAPESEPETVALPAAVPDEPPHQNRPPAGQSAEPAPRAAARPVPQPGAAPSVRTRTVDLTQPGKWSAAHAAHVPGVPAAGAQPPAQTAAQQAARPAPAQPAHAQPQPVGTRTTAAAALAELEEDDQLDLILRKAVGE